MQNTLFFIICMLVNLLCLASETTKHIDLFDKSRNRSVPVELYISDEANTKVKMPLVIINHGYSVKNTEYSFLANALATGGYFVVSIQHDLESDVPLLRTGNLYERRKPLWERGVQNIMFVLKELKTKYTQVDYSNITLIGHSNGGDISMLLAKQHPNLAKNIISLDSLRMPFPRSASLRILSLRANHIRADEGVLPNAEEQKKFGYLIISLPDAKHIDFCDRGPIKVKDKVVNLITKFLEDNISSNTVLVKVEEFPKARNKTIQKCQMDKNCFRENYE
jgi:pimeloyl-ACP methyl ester carboxylesterase